MTQPVPPGSVGSSPSAWGLPGPLPPSAEVPIYGAPGRDLFYVRSPVTGDVRGVPAQEAEALIFQSGWEPVVEPAAVRLLEKQILRERASPASALLYGAARGVSGGLAEFMLPQGDEPGARALDAVREEYPGVTLGTEVAGALLPLSRAAGALRFASPVALAEGAGQVVSRGLGAGQGVGRSILARSTGTALEGGVIGSTYEAGNTRIEDSPLTAQKIASGFFAGALPGAIIGAPLGALEGAVPSLGRRHAQAGEALRKEINTAGVSDADLMKIAHREFGVAVPGLSEELAAALARDPNLTPDFYALAKDSGRVGKVVRNELIDAPALRAQAEWKAAQGMNAIQELDEKAIEGWVHGKPKRELIEEWLRDAPPEVDVDAAIAQARDTGPPTVADAPVTQLDQSLTGPGFQTMVPGGAVNDAQLSPTVIPEEPAVRQPGQTLGGFAKGHEQYKELLAFLNEERRAAGRYERYRTLGIQELGIEGERADRIRRIADTQIGAQRLLEDAAKAGLAERRVVYRGAKLRREDLDALLATDEYRNPAIWSTAETPDAAESFARKKLREGEVPVLFEIAARGAVKADGIPGSETFEEYLLPRGRRLRIVGEENRDGLVVLKLQELPEGAARGVSPQVPRRAQDINDIVKTIRKAAELDDRVKSQLVTRLATTPEGLDEALARGLIARDENVSTAISGTLRAASPEAKAAFSAGARSMASRNPGLVQWRARAGELIDGLGEEADGLLALTPGVRGQPAAEARKVRDLFANARARIATGDRAEAFAALDELKARLGPHAKPDAWLGQDDNVARFVRHAYEDIRQTLEQESLWGPRAAAAQREMNQLFHQRLARADGYFKQFFEDAGRPHPRNPWVNQRVATPDRVRRALQGMTDPQQSPALDLFRAHIAETRAVADKMRKYYNLSPEADASVAQLLKGVDDAERGLNEAVHFAMREGQAAALFNNRANVVPGYAKWVALGFLGPAGFAAAKVAENIANPGQRIYMRAVLERVMRQTESRSANAVLSLVTGKRLPRPLGATQLAARASASLSHEKDPKKRAEGYASSLAELTRLTDPVAAAEAVKQTAPFISNTLPTATAYTGLMFSKAAQYVLAKAPVQPRLTPRGIEVTVPSDAELHEWERIWQGAFDPVSAVEAAAQGKGSVEMMRAAEASAPEFIQDVRMLVLEELPHQELPHNRVVDISIVLGVPLDASLEPEYINAQQMVHAARFKDSESMKSRRTFGETGVNKRYKPGQSGADRVEADIPPE